MPLRLLLVRHGQSEGNLMEDDPVLAEKLKDVPNNELRLTKEGVRQAQAAGDWIRNYLAEDKSFAGRTEGFVSTFVRAKETAGHLKLGVDWRFSPFIVERDWGHFEQLSEEEQKRYKAGKKRNPLYTTMPNGQSLSSLLVGNYLFFGMLHREHSENRVVAVCHGERLLTVRYLLERMTDKKFGELIRSRHVGDRVRNCQVVEYSRINPINGDVQRRYQWMRSFCPWDLREKDLAWKQIFRSKLTDSALLQYTDEFPRYAE